MAVKLDSVIDGPALYEGTKIPSPVPSWLQVAVSRFTHRPDLATQPLGFVNPTIDGRPTHFYEWYAAGRHLLGAGGGSMHRDAGIDRQ